jgi:hypothetical protein
LWRIAGFDNGGAHKFMLKPAVSSDHVIGMLTYSDWQ